MYLRSGVDLYMDNIFTVLEKKFKEKFNGKTGNDLKEYLNKHQNLLSENPSLLMGDSCSFPDKFYLSFEPKIVDVIEKEIKYYDIIPFDDNEYTTLKEMIKAGDKMPMISGYLYDNKDADGFFEMVNKITRICKANNSRALLEFVTPYEEDIDIEVEFNNDKIKQNGFIHIIDDNGEMLLQSYMWIAYRLNNGDINKYLSTFKIKYKKED